MVNQQQVALNDATEWLGDYHPLSEQLGSTSGLLTLASVSRFLKLPEVVDVPSLKRFLGNYQNQVLARFELPSILSAQQHAERNELRELIALDNSLGAEPELELFGSASRRVGQWQLRKLRPLRDQRMVQRYIAAVDDGQAQGWHTLVYGLTLAIYSLPSRQGLVGYAHQVTRGQIYLAAKDLRLSEQDCRDVFEEYTGSFPSLVDDVVRRHAEENAVSE